MSLFEDFIQILRSKTGWKEPKLDEFKHLCFTLFGKNSNEIKLEFFTPEGTILIMQTKLVSLPQDSYDRTEMLKDYAKRQVGACKKRPSVLTVDNNELILYRKEKMQDLENLTVIVNDFLKDVDWWQQKASSESNNPFSFSMSWGK